MDSEGIQDHSTSAQEPCRCMEVEEAAPSTSLERFHLEIAPYLMAWDKATGAALSSAPQQLGERVANIPTPTSTVVAFSNDIALRPAELSAGGLAASRAGSSIYAGQKRCSGEAIVKTRDGQESVVKDLSHAEQDLDHIVDLEMRVKVTDMPPFVPDLPAPANPLAYADKEGKGCDPVEGGMHPSSPLTKVGGDGSCLAPRCDADVYVTTNLEALSMQSQMECAELLTLPPLRAPQGKGGSNRKAQKPGRKMGKHGGAAYKGIAHSASMKVSSPGKPEVALRGKKQLLSWSASQHAGEVPFVVVSSRRPMPSIHTMHGLSATSMDPTGAAPVSPDTAASPQGPRTFQPVAGIPLRSSVVQAPHSGTGKLDPINPWAVSSPEQASSLEVLQPLECGPPFGPPVSDVGPSQPSEAAVQQLQPDPNSGQAGHCTSQVQPVLAEEDCIVELLQLLEADQAGQQLHGTAQNGFLLPEPLVEKVEQAGASLTAAQGLVEPDQAVLVDHLMQQGFGLSAEAVPQGQLMQQGFGLSAEAVPEGQLMQQGFGPSTQAGPVDQLRQQEFPASDQAELVDQPMGLIVSVGEALSVSDVVDSPVTTQGNVPNFDMLL